MKKITFLFFILLLFEINSLLTNENDENNNNLIEEFQEEELSDDIIILHTNDVHCGLLDNIGYDGLMLYKKELQKKYKYVLTVDIGDHIQGDTIGVLSKGLDIIDIMNKIGYDVATIGNHEFDFGLESLEKCYKALNCGYISANYCYRKNKTSIYPQYMIKKVGTKNIGFIGILTPTTLSKTYLSRIVDENGQMVYDFLTENEGKELYDTIQKYINEVKSKGADYIIILSHLGNDVDNLKQYAISTLINHISGVNAVLDGHTHQVYNINSTDKENNEVPIIQVGTKLSNLGILKITNGTIKSEIISEIPKPDKVKDAIEVKRSNNKKRWVDKDMNEYINNIIDSHSDELNEVIGKLNFDLIINLDPNDQHKQISRSEESTLGDLITDAIRVAGEGNMSIMSAGSIRTDLKKGNITYKNILDILPFSNNIIVKEVLGQDILDALEYGVRFLPEKSPKFPQVSGISFKVDITFESTIEVDDNDMFVKVKGDRRVYDAKIGKKKINPKEKYRISFDNYIGAGGDGYSMFRNYEETFNTLKTDNEAFISYIKEDLKGIVPDNYKSTQGRIIINANNNDSNGLIIVIILVFVVIIIFLIVIMICVKVKKKFIPRVSSSDLEKEL